MECQDWWNNNCLYLDEEARQAFYASYSSAVDHQELVKALPRDAALVQTIRQNMDRIRAAGDKLVRGAALPPLADETKGIDREGHSVAPTDG